ncbi:hypothetical protein BKA62DRAFT_680038 [Auriculariales sp. MPI-PUGE-AT-0066]|nr:hypothetical protein BKA62DRAFT_680038 [Auriculariales sp. MPI-PUGE-AT-0066]
MAMARTKFNASCRSLIQECHLSFFHPMPCEMSPDRAPQAMRNFWLMPADPHGKGVTDRLGFSAIELSRIGNELAPAIPACTPVLFSSREGPVGFSPVARVWAAPKTGNCRRLTMTRPGASEAQAIAWEEDEQQRMVPATTGAVVTFAENFNFTTLGWSHSASFHSTGHNFNNRISALFRVFNPRSRRSARIIDATELDSRAVDADVGPVTASEDHDNIPPECPVACFSPSACSCVIALDGSCTPAPPQSWRLPISLPQHEVCGQDEDARSDGPVESPVPRSDFVSTPLSTTSASNIQLQQATAVTNPTSGVPGSAAVYSTKMCHTNATFVLPVHSEYVAAVETAHDSPSAESELTITVDFDLLADMPALSLNSASTASSSDTESPEHLGTQPVTPRSPRKRPDMHLKIVPRSMLSTLSPTLLSPTPLSPGSFDPYPERPDEECEGWRASAFTGDLRIRVQRCCEPRTPGFDLKITRS